MKIVVIVLFALVVLKPTVNGQGSDRNPWGLGLSMPGPAASYPVLLIDGWFKPWERTWLNFELGYGWENTPTQPSDQPPEIDARRVSIAAQGMFDFVYRPYFSFFGGSGPYWLRSSGDLRQGYVNNIPEGSLTTYEQASYTLTRLGLQNTIGIRLFIGYVSFGTRLHFPVFYSKTTVTDLENPILVLDYKPGQILPYQEAKPGIDASFGLSFYFGCVIR